MSTRCSGVDCRDTMTAAVAAISEARTKKCQAGSVGFAGGRDVRLPDAVASGFAA